MKKLLPVFVVGVIVLGVVLYIFMPKASTKSKAGDLVRPTASTSPRFSTSSATAIPGRYIPYDARELSATTGTKIIFFHASWCPQCRKLEADIKAGPIPDGVTIYKADYDSSQALRQKYGVTLQTTLVKVGENGRLIKKYVAYEDPTLASLKQNLLP